MRQSEFAGGTIKYPDSVLFVYNPNYIILDNIFANDTANILFVNQETQRNIEINVSLINGHAEVYISKFLQLQLSGNRFITLLIVVTIGGIQHIIEVGCIYGSLNIGERFGQIGSFVYDEEEKNFIRRVRWFKNFPFKVSIFSQKVSAKYSYRYDNKQYLGSRDLRKGYVDVSPKDVVQEAKRFAVFKVLPDGSEVTQSTFDGSFDYTFNTLLSSVTFIRMYVDESTDGHYFRWIDPMGQLQYFLFTNGTEQIKVNDSEQVEDEVESNGIYFGRIMRTLEKTRTKELKCCAVNLNTYEQDYVKTIVSSINCEMYVGSRDGSEIWMPVNVKAGTFSISEKENLQDFEIVAELPISQTQTR